MISHFDLIFLQEACHAIAFLSTETLFQYKMSLKEDFDSNTR